MSWLWLDLVADAPATALASVPVREPDGVPAGVLAFSAREGLERPGDALRVDGRLVALGPDEPATADDEPAWVSWCRLSPGHSLAFDDGAVSAAIRRCLQQPWPGAVSTLLVDWSRIAGAVTMSRSRRAAEDDPFARVFPRRLLRAPGASIPAMTAPTGPCITRYGSGNPWPWDRYVGQAP